MGASPPVQTRGRRQRTACAVPLTIRIADGREPTGAGARAPTTDGREPTGADARAPTTDGLRRAANYTDSGWARAHRCSAARAPTTDGLRRAANYTDSGWARAHRCRRAGRQRTACAVPLTIRITDGREPTGAGARAPTTDGLRRAANYTDSGWARAHRCRRAGRQRTACAVPLTIRIADGREPTGADARADNGRLAPCR